MTRGRGTWPLGLLLVIALLIALFGAAGCGSQKPAGAGQGVAKPAGETAKHAYGTALSAAEATAAPDAKLVLVQTSQAVTPTSTPVWAYLFGSPKTEKLYVVRIEGGKALGPSDYGTAKKGQIDWAKIPGVDRWKIDSDEAYVKAARAAGITSPVTYQMGFLTYVPSSQATQTAEPYVWNVRFSSGFAGIVRVDVTTGKTTTVQ